jgi:hypothetical protein
VKLVANSLSGNVSKNNRAHASAAFTRDFHCAIDALSGAVRKHHRYASLRQLLRAGHLQTLCNIIRPQTLYSLSLIPAALLLLSSTDGSQFQVAFRSQRCARCWNSALPGTIPIERY